MRIDSLFRFVNTFFSSVYFSLSLGFFSFVVLVQFSSLDFDPHHDGYMLADAISISQGKFLFSEAFGQYGPITPWIQALFVGLPFESPALALRILNSLMISISVFLCHYTLLAQYDYNNYNFPEVTVRGLNLNLQKWVEICQSGGQYTKLQEDLQQ
mgnify:CR=1 FL=1